jgi:hypothetical protein
MLKFILIFVPINHVALATNRKKEKIAYALNRFATMSQLMTLKNASIYSGRRF